MRPLHHPLVALLLLVPVPTPAQAPDPDSTLGRRRTHLLPAIASAPETGLQYGATVLRVSERPSGARTRPTSVLGYALRTARGQTRLGVETERWSRGNARRYAASVVWQRYPLPFHGFGDTASAAAKEIFTPSGIEATASFQQRLVRSLYGTTGLRVVDQAIRTDSVGVLREGTIAGASGGRAVELSVGALADTRDNLFDPTRGALVQLSYARSGTAWGADWDYDRLRLDARAYRAVGTGGTLGTVAVQLLTVGVNGDAPFDQVALVGGGDIMRGYARGRYRDRWMAASQVEYRSPILGYAGGVIFGGAGTVAPRAGALGSSRLLPTYGVGLRVLIDRAQRNTVRADYARGDAGSSGLHIGFNHAF